MAVLGLQAFTEHEDGAHEDKVRMLYLSRMCAAVC